MVSPALPDDLVGCRDAMRHLGREARVLVSTGSTNDAARAWAREGAPSGAVVIADRQTAGRGRQGRGWSAPPGETLAMSVILRPSVPPANLPLLAIVVGLAARAAIARRLDPARAVQVKWPNDVWIDGRKVAGVLIEASITMNVDAQSRALVEHVIAGVGVNVARQVFPESIAEGATSLALAGSTCVDRTALAIDLLGRLDVELAAWIASPSSVRERLAPHDALFGRRVRFDAAEKASEGVARGVAADGRLQVECDDGRLVLASAGEITPLG